MILAVDIGGTSVKLGLVNDHGHLIHKAEASVCFDNYKTPILDTAIKEARAFLNEAHAQIDGIGVSATGQIDSKQGIVIGTNGKIPNYKGAPIKQAFEEEFARPTYVLNDANAAALGECWHGAGSGVSDVLMVTLGTGVGGGIVIGGKIFTGWRGLAGEIGHFTLYQNGIPCTCGKRGCFEQYASTTALIRLAQEETGESGLDGRTIFARAHDGDTAMLQVLDRWIDDIAAGLSGLVHIFNPRLLIIGGGVSEQEELLFNPLRVRVHEMIMPRFKDGLGIFRAHLGNDAGLIGAAKYFLDERPY